MDIIKLKETILQDKVFLIQIFKKYSVWEKKEKAKASRLLTSAVEGGYIKVMDLDTTPRYKKYIPYWA